jgi:hypothetical protein
LTGSFTKPLPPLRTTTYNKKDTEHWRLKRTKVVLGLDWGENAGKRSEDSRDLFSVVRVRRV